LCKAYNIGFAQQFFQRPMLHKKGNGLHKNSISDKAPERRFQFFDIPRLTFPHHQDAPSGSL
jgi:hypothetical protein